MKFRNRSEDWWVMLAMCCIACSMVVIETEALWTSV